MQFVLKDGPKNLTLLVKGRVGPEDFPRRPILDVTGAASLKGLRLDTATWAIQEKMGFLLWWEDSDEEESLILPMESRNFLKFPEGIASPRIQDGWGGKLYLSSFRADEPTGLDKWFFFMLEFDKQ